MINFNEKQLDRSTKRIICGFKTYRDRLFFNFSDFFNNFLEEIGLKCIKY